MKFMQRGLAVLMAVCLLLSGGLTQVMAEASGNEAELVEMDCYVYTFEGTPLATEFNDNQAGFGMSHAFVKAQMIAGEGAIEGHSPRLNVADLRWWNVNYTGKVMGFSFDLLFDDHWKDTEVVFSALNHLMPFGDAQLFTIRPGENGDPTLYNHDNEPVAVLPRNRACTVAAIVEYGVKGYDLLVDGQVVAADNAYAQDSAFYSVKEMQFTALPMVSGSQSYVVADNIRMYVLGKPYPQPHSFQEPGKVPKITLPTIPSVEGVAVYANETMISKPAADADGAMLLPLEETVQGLGATAAVHGDGSATIVTDKASFTLSADGKTLSWNDDQVTLNTPAAVVEGILYAPGQVFAETLDAKVWYSEALEMIVLSTGDAKNDDVLRSIGGSFWMNGQPYYEISYNKWDLNNQIFADPSFHNGEFISSSWHTAETTLAGAEAALKELSEDGFKSIRIFCDVINPKRSAEELETYWKASDAMYDLCDKYGIRLVPCLGLIGLTGLEFIDGQCLENGEWVSGTENYYDLVADPDSNSRGCVNEFIKQYVNRYKDRDTVLMWEIVNEGNLDADIGSGNSASYSLLQLGQYYTDVANEIRKYDDTRLITGGDSMLRSAQWNLFEAVMKGGGHDWTLDTASERRKALWVLHNNLDVVSTHGYHVGYDNSGGHMYYAEKKGTRVYTRLITWEFLLQEARSLGLPLYAGEVIGLIDENGKGIENHYIPYTPEVAAAHGRYLDTMIEAGVQLTHWWTFRSDRDYGNGEVDMVSVSREGTPDTYEAIKVANEKLQAKYIVNPLDAENTHTLSAKEGDGATPYVEETTVPDVTEAPTDALTTDTPNEGGCASALGGGLASVVMLGGLWLAFSRKKD